MVRCPTLSDLPPPPVGRTGWPWTEATTQLPNKTLDEQEWPRIGIVTPSYHQAQYVEETIRSVLLQGYPNLEYIVMDGGSTDGSVEIIRKYEAWLSLWRSEPDGGQSDAINKGFALATGSLFGWLNSDDVFTPGTIGVVASAHARHPASIIAGAAQDVLQDGDSAEPLGIIVSRNLSLADMVRYWEEKSARPQPAMFFPARLWRDVRGLDSSLHYCMDYDLLCKMVRRTAVEYLPDVLARFRFHANSKSVSRGREMLVEGIQVSRRYWGLVDPEVRREARSVSVNHLVRWAGTMALRGQLATALSYMAEALDIDAMMAVRAILRQSAAGSVRQARGLATRTHSPP